MVVHLVKEVGTFYEPTFCQNQHSDVRLQSVVFVACILESVGIMNSIAEILYIILSTDNYDIAWCLICRNKHIGIMKIYKFAI